jgi:hypothetical protein
LSPLRIQALRWKREGFADHDFLSVYGGERLPQALENGKVDIPDGNQDNHGFLPSSLM